MRLDRVRAWREAPLSRGVRAAHSASGRRPAADELAKKLRNPSRSTAPPQYQQVTTISVPFRTRRPARILYARSAENNTRGLRWTSSGSLSAWLPLVVLRGVSFGRATAA